MKVWHFISQAILILQCDFLTCDSFSYAHFYSKMSLCDEESSPLLKNQERTIIYTKVLNHHLISRQPPFSLICNTCDGYFDPSPNYQSEMLKYENSIIHLRLVHAVRKSVEIVEDFISSGKGRQNIVSPF